MLRRPRRLALTVAALCLLTACTPTSTPTPSPAPGYRCTPAQYDEMVAKDKLYAEAEAVYRRFLAEEDRIFRKGGVTTATSVLKETTTGDFLAESLADYKSMAERNITVKGAAPSLVYFERAPGRSKGGSVVSATVCVDGSSLEFFRSGKSLGQGRVYKDDTYFAEVEGAIKIIGADGSQVKSCE